MLYFILFGFIGFFLLIVVVFGVLVYNSIINNQNLVDEAWSNVEVLLKRRYDLIPNLVNTVKGYKNFERETLEKVVKARNQAIKVPDKDLQNKSKVETELQNNLHHLIALAEDYPELKVNQQFLSLQKELSKTEDILSRARRYYNGTVRNYNIKINQFPDLIIAKLMNFREKKYFETDDKANPEINLNSYVK